MADIYTPFIKNERQQMLFNKAEALADKAQTRVSETEKAADFSLETLKDLKQANYVSLPLPKSYGGEELSLYELLLLQERLAVGDGSTSLSIGWHMGIVMEQSERETRTWSQEAYDLIASEIGKNNKVINTLATEPATGSPTRGGIPQTTAKKQGEAYVLNGRKSFATMSSVLDYYLITAFVEEEETIGTFLLSKGTAGVSIEQTWDTLGMRGTGSNDVILKDVSVPLNHLVEVNRQKKSSPKGWLLHIPACYLGIAIAARNEAVTFAKNYQPNSLDTPIAEVPHIKQKIGEMELKLMHARYFMYTIAEKWDQHPDSRGELAPELAAVKTVATNAANEVVDLAMRIAGGRGLSKKFRFEQLYRDVRAGLHNPPMDDAVISMLASKAINEDI
ncbi:acyl-CoA dehydrogenase family protein [Radiobacillus sp. PE A8.2]|uniref:acyl-CoA dehydrogenase family protein n=1 Tax=Radiobacillus sp. PE A8.2 TaxID=3380349 RepID=UPI00388F2D27